MRAFLALPLSKDLCKKIHSDFSFLSSPSIRLVPPENLHITLNFFGSINQKQKEDIIKKLESFSMKPFEITLKGLGVFPSPSFIRVIYLKVFVEKEVENSLKTLSFSMGGEPFSSLHLTIARVKSKINPSFLSIKTNEYKEGINRIVLYESILKKPSPLYKEIHSKYF